MYTLISKDNRKRMSCSQQLCVMLSLNKKASKIFCISQEEQICFNVVYISKIQVNVIILIEYREKINWLTKLSLDYVQGGPDGYCHAMLQLTAGQWQCPDRAVESSKSRYLSNSTFGSKKIMAESLNKYLWNRIGQVCFAIDHEKWGWRRYNNR